MNSSSSKPEIDDLLKIYEFCNSKSFNFNKKVYGFLVESTAPINVGDKNHEKIQFHCWENYFPKDEVRDSKINVTSNKIAKVAEILNDSEDPEIVVRIHGYSTSEDNQTAMIQTRSWWYTTMQKHGYRKRQILTVGNVLVTLKLPYMVRIKSTKKTKNQTYFQGFCPLLKWLGMSEGLTPLVWSTVAQYGAIASSFEAAYTILTGWGINLSFKRIERLTYNFGKIGINLRQSKIKN